LYIYTNIYIIIVVKDIIFMGSSRVDLREFPDAARRDAGIELYQIQHGLEPGDWKPMTGVGAGVRELRIRAGGACRIIYLATRPEGVYVLHCFRKKTQKTAQSDIELAKKRYQQIGE
jgi:phage-related protein